ncbi:GPI-anchored adhesin-like protein PGA55, partial [Asbolus verrucosus]
MNCKRNGSAGSHSTRTTSQSSSTSDSASETPTTSSESVQSCLCCKRKNVTTKTLYALRKKLSDKAYPLCRPCYRQNQRGAYSPNMYSNPGHVCNCYTVVETKTLDQIKKTISDLNDLDEQFCSCVNASDRDSSGYCRYCNCKLKKTSKNKNGIAYMLTFENESLSDEKKKKKKKKKQPRLEEIKIKIPVARKKKHKDKENKRKKESHSHSEENSTTSGAPKNTYNLQEYLKQNRPDFVEVAENRRKSVVDAKVQREELSDFNKLLFLQNYLEGNSDKKMKEITRRNYQKLPEVQQKLMDNRERQIRQANRLMADTFNK